MLTYKGFVGKVEYDDEAKVLFGRVINTRDIITFQANSAEGIEYEFRESVEDYLDMCLERGKEPEKPYSGKFVLRLSPEEHRKVSLAAQLSSKSLNAWITEQIVEQADMALGK